MTTDDAPPPTPPDAVWFVSPAVSPDDALAWPSRRWDWLHACQDLSRAGRPVTLDALRAAVPDARRREVERFFAKLRAGTAFRPPLRRSLAALLPSFGRARVDRYLVLLNGRDALPEQYADGCPPALDALALVRVAGLGPCDNASACRRIVDAWKLVMADARKAPPAPTPE